MSFLTIAKRGDFYQVVTEADQTVSNEGSVRYFCVHRISPVGPSIVFADCMRGSRKGESVSILMVNPNLYQVVEDCGKVD